MIENPRDLHTIAIALRVAIAEGERVGTVAEACAHYQATLEKVDRLRARWRRWQARRPRRRPEQLALLVDTGRR